ncbi:Replication factor C subunit 4 [Heterocephalus glaber]|uniref:Replication factor C subunit 4 n=1 Tax=Heterocephalus glaber TaxID=10181 RepID=G5BQ87_HETGA|nr:Replication factor C subunit 4 [Heterocephalus glaber]
MVTEASSSGPGAVGRLRSPYLWAGNSGTQYLGLVVWCPLRLCSVEPGGCLSAAGRIIEPLTSRCSKFRFKPLSDKIQQQRLLDIAEKENVKISNEGIAYLVKVSRGDLRKVITFFQSTTRLTGGKEVTEKVITDIAGVIPAETIDKIFAACQSGSFDKLEAVVKSLINEGHAAAQLVNQVYDAIVENDNLSDKQKSIMTEKLAEADKGLADDADEYLQLISLCATVMQQLTQNC